MKSVLGAGRALAEPDVISQLGDALQRRYHIMRELQTATATATKRALLSELESLQREIRMLQLRRDHLD